ncbi:ATP synthase F1 subunit delta [Candidatus Peregrinibacteria bacterium CG_4_10_14_0_2_um_filter_38_24]|nr:MAG: ATP synthase F1 subunit delta [Candidatus Peregrinibacteria bacterium CG_4_10_14_0_2_um_filter_38_24]PJC38901.1 MAG: ATP synthase F1 subunit delta [Candidatus Peregrinibacteria bacterium CG_4_9_14_0_2_um_filter_38_9]
MRISLKKYAQALTDSLHGEKDSAVINERIQNLLKLLVKRKQSKLIKQFAPVFFSEWMKKNGKVFCKVTVPYELNDAETEDLEKLLSSALNRKASIEVKVDADIIGGMKIEFEDYIIDGTVLTGLKTLKSQIVNA